MTKSINTKPWHGGRVAESLPETILRSGREPLRWSEAPRRTEWGAGMMVTDVALGKGHTLTLFADSAALHLVALALAAEPSGNSGALQYGSIAERAEDGLKRGQWAVTQAPQAQAVLAWRCFHCDESFTDAEQAQLHFGNSEHDRPACQFSVEHIRWMEAQHRRNVDDDSEALRTVRSLAGEHEALRRRAEEEGYARGLRDAQKHPEELGLVAAPPLQRQPLTEAEIEDCIDEANRAFNASRHGVRGQQVTSYDDWKHWLARVVETKHGITRSPKP